MLKRPITVLELYDEVLISRAGDQNSDIDANANFQTDLVIAFFRCRFFCLVIRRTFSGFFIFRPLFQLLLLFRAVRFVRFFRLLVVKFRMVEPEKLLHRNVGFGVEQVDLVVLVVVFLLGDRRLVVVRVLSRKTILMHFVSNWCKPRRCGSVGKASFRGHSLVQVHRRFDSRERHFHQSLFERQVIFLSYHAVA